MKRLYWNLRKGLAGGCFFAADNCPYFISVYSTMRGTRAVVMNSDFIPISREMKIESAKSNIRERLKREGRK